MNAIPLCSPPKRTPLLTPVLGTLLIAAAQASDHALTFKLNTHPTAVALQFDVTSSDPATTLSLPTFSGISPHAVESAVIGSGATRYVVYSTTGEAISADGKVLVTFSSPQLQSSMLTVSGVMASNADGQQKLAFPNALPIVIPHTPTYASAQVGSAVPLSATAYDLDGSLTSLRFNEGGTPFTTVFSYTPGSTDFMPAASGSFSLSATAVDIFGDETTASLGEVRAYTLSELVTFADFESIHFGTAADPSDLGFGTQPFGHGIANGLAWLLGINPNSPDFSKLPQGTVETNGTGQEFVFRFNALANHPGAAWDVLETPALTPDSWDSVPVASITETPLGDGTVDVEVRKPIDPVTAPKAFLALEVTETE